MLQGAAQGIVPVGENVRLDDDGLPHHPLDGVAAQVDLGRDVLDRDPRGRQRGGREEWVLGAALSFIPIAGGIVRSFVDAYAYLAIGCTLGFAVFKKARELGWD